MQRAPHIGRRQPPDIRNEETAVMKQNVVIGELAAPEYARRIGDGWPVLVPLGALEQHGPHMSMNPDVLLPTAIGIAVARNIEALVAPAIAYGYKWQQKSG